MIASEIPKVVKNFVKRDNPYHCLMIDGEWGIGKSFQIKRALKEIPDAASVSLFGVSSTEEILTQLSIGLCTGSHKKSEVADLSTRIMSALEEADIRVLSKALKAINTALPPQNLLEMFFNRMESDEPQKTCLIIFDDIERVNEKIDFDNFLGTIETAFLSHTNVKVLFVANLQQLSEPIREIWEKYSEKIVDRILYIDELAEVIEFFPLEEENRFALDFMNCHGSKNLRTLQKADNFFRDVQNQVQAQDADLLNNVKQNSLRLVCYSIVFEDIEKIYKKKNERRRAEKKAKKEDTLFDDVLCDTLEGRVQCQYLNTDGLATALVGVLVAYQQRGTLQLEGLLSILRTLHVSKKPTYYKSDEEVKEEIEELELALKQKQYSGMGDFVAKANLVLRWSPVLHKNTEQLEIFISEQLIAEYREWLSMGGEPRYDLTDVLLDIEDTPAMQKILLEFEKQEKTIYVDWLIDQFQAFINKNDYDSAYQMIKEIIDMLEGVYAKHIATTVRDRFMEALCNENVLVKGSVSRKQFLCCKKAYDFAMGYQPGRYQEFLNECKRKYSSDQMFEVRMDDIEQAFEITQKKS